MMKSLLVAAVLSLTGVAHAEVYVLDTKASTVDWKGTKKIGEKFHNGKIQVKGGEVTTDKKNNVTGGNVVIDMTTITNDDLAADKDSQAKLVGHLSNEDFFNVKKYPTSTFKIKSVSAQAKDEVLVKGDLTMIGKTQAIEFPAKIKAEAGALTGDAVVKIDRTKWGLKYGSGNIFKELSADKIINDEIELTLKLVANKAPEAKKEEKKAKK